MFPRLTSSRIARAIKLNKLPAGLPLETKWYLNLRKGKKTGSWQIFYVYMDDQCKEKTGGFTFGTLFDFPTREEALEVAEYLMQQAMGMGIEATARRAVKNANNRAAKFTTEWYSQKMVTQQGKCAICGRTPKRLVVDHDHDDGQLRGLLCCTCNSGIGMLRDDIVLVRKAVAYLEEHGQ